MSFFAKVAPMYQRQISEPRWATYPHANSDPLEAVGIFLEEYAFEWQGRDPRWPLRAGAVIRSFSKRPLSEICANDCWIRFRESLKSAKKSNPAHNPMAPKGIHFKRKNTDGVTKKLSAIEFVQQKVDNEKGLVAWAVKGLADDRTRGVHEKLCGINGIGEKIASFFLRDVACRYQTFPKNDRYLLQPIDIWIRRTIEGITKQKWNDDQKRAEWIVQNSAGQSELVNQGIWYFGSRIATFRLNDVLSSVNKADELIREYVTGLRDAADAWTQ